MRRSTPRRRPARTAAVLAVTGLAATMTAAPASAAAHDPQPGAAGIGDPYYPDYGNGGYDVGHYGLKLKYQPATDRLDGTATIAARATQDISRFDLDFALDTTSVTVNGAPAKFERSGDHELVITPARPLYKNRPFTVVVTYTGVPSSVKAEGFTSWMRTPDGGVAANEPESAWWWFPSNDHPSDKATFDVDVSVPQGTQAISNGLRTSEVTRDGWTRSTWHQDRPQTTYLATLALGKFDVQVGRSPSGIPSIIAYSRDLGSMTDNAKASVGRTGEIIDWESRYFGKYPFNSIGGYVPNVTAKFAVETETRPMFGPTDFFVDGPDTYVIAHENSHQWFGDGVSLTRWKDIWLNEGFATYAEWLWSDHLGEGTPAQLAAKTYAAYPADDPFWTVPPGDPGPAKQFDAAVYDRGALTLQALRDTVGDRDFFTILRTWAQSRKYGNGSTPQFVALAEKISGKQLGSLFDTWLYTPSRPSEPAARAVGLDAAPAATPKSWNQIQATHRALGTVAER